MKISKRIKILMAFSYVLAFILGIAITLHIEYGGGNGTVLVLPLVGCLVWFGWIWRGLIEDGKK